MPDDPSDNKARNARVGARVRVSLDAGHSLAALQKALSRLLERRAGPIKDEDFKSFVDGSEDAHTFNDKKLSVIEILCEIMEKTPVGLEPDLNRYVIANDTRPLFEISNIVAKSNLAMRLRAISGSYLCFYRTLEDEQSESFHAVRYVIEGRLKNSSIVARYSTRRSLRKAISDLSCVMIMDDIKDNLFSVIHFDDTEGKRVMYSLLRCVTTNRTEESPNGKNFFYGITVREHNAVDKIISYKVIWIPEEKNIGDRFNIGQIITKDKLDDESWTFLTRCLDSPQSASTNACIEIGVEIKGAYLLTYINDYVDSCGTKPLIRPADDIHVSNQIE